MMEATGKIPNAWSTSGSILGEGKGREGHQHPERVEDDEHHDDHVELWILAERDAELPRLFASLEAK